jgi:hypothetical protein
MDTEEDYAPIEEDEAPRQHCLDPVNPQHPKSMSTPCPLVLLSMHEWFYESMFPRVQLRPSTVERVHCPLHFLQAITFRESSHELLVVDHCR